MVLTIPAFFGPNGPDVHLAGVGGLPKALVRGRQNSSKGSRGNAVKHFLVAKVAMSVPRHVCRLRTG